MLFNLSLKVVKEWAILASRDRASSLLSALMLQRIDSFLKKLREVSDYRSVQTE